VRAVASRSGAGPVAYDALEILTGPVLRAIGSLTAASVVPGGQGLRAPASLRALLVPRFYFEDGRDRPVRMPEALSYGHRVEALEICVALSGSPLLAVEGKLYRLWDGRMAVLAPGVRHFESCGRRARPYELVWIIARPEGASLHVTAYTPGSGYLIVAPHALARPGQLAAEIAAEIGAVALERNRVCRLRAALAAFASRCAHVLLAGGRSVADAEAAASVARAKAFIREHYAERICVADVAAAAHLSPNHLSSVFKQHTGRTVLEEIHALKLAEASSRLRESDAPVKQIAAELGFESPYYFSRFFRRATGVAPSRYRAGG